ncbi:Glutamyl-tRNA(Gln) amidotransferase subunit A 1 [Nymphon striatum]|nr:Glutamyl-tRNA(Gln) amidotransferase subunit A 1 [Nymphon striatum]
MWLFGLQSIHPWPLLQKMKILLFGFQNTCSHRFVKYTMSDLPPHGLNATEAAQKIREEQTDGQLKAWAHLDKEQALAQAKELDDNRMRGRPMGSLHGIPVGLKDIIDTKNLPTERGTEIFKGRQPDTDATILLPNLHFMHAAGTANPHNPAHSPGGSSSGSAAAVAGFHVPLAIGTQTNGSVIRPASFCGTFGFKPSRGIISRTGILQTSNSLDQVGVFGRSLEDVALLSDAIGSYDPLDEKSYSHHRPHMMEGVDKEVEIEPELAWFDLPFADRLSQDSKDGFEEVISALGERVTRIEAPTNFTGLVETQRIIHEYEICMHQAEVFENHFEKISTTLKPTIERGRQISRDEYEYALDVMKQTESFLGEFFLDLRRY